MLSRVEPNWLAMAPELAAVPRREIHSVNIQIISSGLSADYQCRLGVRNPTYRGNKDRTVLINS